MLYIERALVNTLDIPVFDDDQHGTAVVVPAGPINALRLKGKGLHAVSVAVSGAWAAAIAVTRMLIAAGVRAFHTGDRHTADDKIHGKGSHHSPGGPGRWGVYCGNRAFGLSQSDE